MNATGERVWVDWLILADAAEISNGKLYLLGGGWDRLTVNTGFPLRQHCAIAAAFGVPWNETNRPLAIEIEILDEDHQQSLFRLEGQVEVGRPPGILPQLQRAQIAASVDLELKRPGNYVIIARIEGEDCHRTPFSVVPGPLLAARAIQDKLDQGQQGEA